MARSSGDKPGGSSETNAVWKVYWEDYRIIVESQKRFDVEYPVPRRDGTVSWDFPGRIPEYIKVIVAREYRKRYPRNRA